MDCCLRLPLLTAQDMKAAQQLMQHAADAVVGNESTLSNTAAVASLASAMSSMMKRAVQFLNAAAQEQDPAAAAAAAAAAGAGDGVTAAAASLPAIAAPLLRSGLPWAVHKAAALMSTCSSRSRLNQAAASVAFLSVLHARSLVQLADAMEAAGPQLLFKSLTSDAQFRLRGAFMRAIQCCGPLV
jgi:hypothetical protein